MKKSVLIIDTPDNCKECSRSKCPSWVDDDARPKECPLRPLPDKRQCNEYTWNEYHAGFDQGVNYTISAITGEKYTPPKYQEGRT